MNIKLGINCGFAINRYIEPEEWCRIVGEELQLKYVQFVADLLNPFLPEDYINEQITRINKAASKYDINIASVFTSAFTRVNHLMHSDKRGREIWLNWFKKLLEIGHRLQASTIGSHFGIMSFASYNDPKKRRELVKEAIKNWQELSFYAQELAYESLLFEPMSVPREMACTIEETEELLEKVNNNCGVPMKICLDIGHAPHPKVRDPYLWIEKLGSVSPVVHLQQTILHASKHWPFTPEYNKQGIIDPKKVLNLLIKSGAKDVLLLFEISHREHWDTDFKVIEDLKDSVNYWRKFIKE